MAKELNLKIKPGTEIYKVIAAGEQEVEVVIMMEMSRNKVLVEALYGEPFDRSSYFGSAYMVCQAVYPRPSLQFSRIWD